jgi:hypothetical protein
MSGDPEPFEAVSEAGSPSEAQGPDRAKEGP